MSELKELKATISRLREINCQHNTIIKQVKESSEDWFESVYDTQMVIQLEGLRSVMDSELLTANSILIKLENKED